MSTLLLVSLALAAGLIVPLLANRRRLLTRASTRASRRAEKAAAADPDAARRLAGAKRWLAVHDALLRRDTRRHLMAVARLDARLRHQLVDLASRVRTALDALDEHLRSRAAAVAVAPSRLSRTTVIWINIAAFSGDIAVTSMAITAAAKDANQVVAVVMALAIAAALFMLGKLLGAVVARWFLAEQNWGRAAMAAGLVLAGLAVSLVLLREEEVLAWLLLGITPAFAAGAATILGPRDEHRLDHRSSKRWDKQRSALLAAAGRLGRTLESAEDHRSAARVLLVRDLVAVEQAIAVEALLCLPDQDLTASVTAIDEVLARLGAASDATGLARAHHDLAELTAALVATTTPEAAEPDQLTPEPIEPDEIEPLPETTPKPPAPAFDPIGTVVPRGPNGDDAEAVAQ